MPDSFPILARRIALALPNIEQGIACEGTAVESRTFKVNGKAFLFLRPGPARKGAPPDADRGTIAMLKLAASLMTAVALGEKHSGRVVAGAGGWTKIVADAEWSPPAKFSEQWIKESYALFAGPSASKSAKTPRKAPAKPEAPKKKTTKSKR